MHLQMIAISGHGNDPPEEKHFPRLVHMVQLLPQPIFVQHVHQTTYSFGNTPLHLMQQYFF
jgi:hypothetical protein